MAKLQGKRAVVLGASSVDNMGQVIARRFLAEGASVLVSGRKQDVLQAFASEAHCQWHACDLTKEDEVAALADAAVAKLGGIDIAINATGWGLLKPYLDTTADELARMVALQFTGPFQFFQAMLRVMTGPGSLIQISSATATIMLEDHAAYMGTKAGIDHVMRCIANQFGARGIKANSISPGLTDTPMTAGAKQVPGLFESFLPGYPLGRIGTSEDIAAAAVWLSSDECFMTGQNLQVNGGLTLRRNPTNAEMQAAIAAAKKR